MRRDNFDGKDYLKLAEDCVYYAWQNEKISDEELEKTSRAVGLAKNRTDYIRKRIAYYSDRLEHCSVFTSEYTTCLTAVQIYKELLNE